eukprot:CAMPEP_0115648432 /NCGR_PEP_ID=MMETSP0272-20121206/39974_1 /TAXON_ID=71861 /ORGANISM="Scrippsiella trochoidea, Strain CCMP3099" /LENGTH=48 /DNA_ID= /DNA_START= /DNA_END= /DNA_ORIENTATION=
MQVWTTCRAARWAAAGTPGNCPTSLTAAAAVLSQPPALESAPWPDPRP